MQLTQKQINSIKLNLNLALDRLKESAVEINEMNENINELSNQIDQASSQIRRALLTIVKAETQERQGRLF